MVATFCQQQNIYFSKTVPVLLENQELSEQPGSKWKWVKQTKTNPQRLKWGKDTKRNWFISQMHDRENVWVHVCVHVFVLRRLRSLVSCFKFLGPSEIIIDVHTCNTRHKLYFVLFTLASTLVQLKISNAFSVSGLMLHVLKVTWSVPVLTNRYW